MPSGPNWTGHRFHLSPTTLREFNDFQYNCTTTWYNETSITSMQGTAVLGCQRFAGVISCSTRINYWIGKFTLRPHRFIEWVLAKLLMFWVGWEKVYLNPPDRAPRFIFKSSGRQKSSWWWLWCIVVGIYCCEKIISGFQWGLVMNMNIQYDSDSTFEANTGFNVFYGNSYCQTSHSCRIRSRSNWGFLQILLKDWLWMK